MPELGSRGRKWFNPVFIQICAATTAKTLMSIKDIVCMAICCSLMVLLSVVLSLRSLMAHLSELFFKTVLFFCIIISECQSEMSRRDDISCNSLTCYCFFNIDL